MQYSHIGWTPCINGHLDFGLVKPGIQGGFTNPSYKDKKTTNINYSYSGQSGSHARRVMLQSKVEWKDTLGDDYDGQMRVFLVAQVAESQFLDARAFSGSLFIYSEHRMAKLRDQPSGWLQCANKKLFPSRYATKMKETYPWFGSIHNAKEILESEELCTSETVKQLDIIFEDLKHELRKINDICHEVYFKVLANGITYLKLSDVALSVLNPEEQYAILRQAFYYIKYSIHDHKHHDGQVDSLTTIIQYDDSNSGKRDVALRLIGQLKRELTQIKRTYSRGDKYHKGDALGIVAYARSFCITLKSAGFLNEKLFIRELSYLDSLSQSLKAQREKIDKVDKLRERAISTSRVHLGWLLSIVSIVSVFLYRSFIDVPKTNKFTLDLSLLHAVVIFVVFLMLIFLAYKFYQNNKIDTVLDDEDVKFWITNNYLKDNIPYYGEKLLSMFLKLSMGVGLLAFSLYFFIKGMTPPISCKSGGGIVQYLCTFMECMNYFFIWLSSLASTFN